MWAKADNSVVWHIDKRSGFEDFQAVLIYGAESAIGLWQISHSCNEKNMHSSEVLQTKSCAWFQGHIFWMRLFFCLWHNMHVCVYVYVYVYVYVQSKWSLSCITSVTNLYKTFWSINFKTIKGGTVKIIREMRNLCGAFCQDIRIFSNSFNLCH